MSAYIVIFLLFIFSCGNASSVNNSEIFQNIPITNASINKNISRRRMSFRLEEERPKNESLEPLNIYFDFLNFDSTFPPELGDKEIIKTAMNKAKDMLKEMLLINIDLNGIIEYDEEDSIDDWEIDNYNSEVFNKAYLKDFNFYIVFSFDDTINSAMTCQILDIFGDAPVLGKIIINPNEMENYKSKPDFSEYLTTYTLHHLIHLLGFHAALGGIIVWGGIVKEETISSEINYYVDSENIINYAKKYFNCTEITKIDLEVDEDGNAYWPSRILLGELMTNFDYPEEQILSGFTLAFLEDLPYIHVVQNYTGGIMKFGKNKRCDFLDKSCGDNSINNEIIFANEFYLPSTLESLPDPYEPSCSSGRLSKTIHKIYTSTSKPTGSEYYISGFTGPEKTKYCPISEFHDINSDDNIYTGHCSNEISANKELKNILDESFTEHSYCVLSSLISKEKENYETYSEYRAVCHEMFCSSESLTIKIKNKYIVCPRAGGQIKAKNFQGYLLCPDFNLICTGTTLCNNLFNCFNGKSEEKEETFYYEYDIATTQNSEIYKTGLEDKKNNYELSSDGKCPILCKQCLEDKTCIECALHYKLNNNKKSCIEIVPNCIKFYNDEDDICIECKDGYFLSLEDKNNRNFVCQLNDPTNQYYLTYDEELGINYYIKCHNGVEQCSLCESNTKMY